MVNLKKNLWIIALIGSIITLVSFLTPVIIVRVQNPSYTRDFYLWMFNFYLIHIYGNGIHSNTLEFDTELISLIPAILCSLLIILFSIINIIIINKCRKKVLDPKIRWLTLPLLKIVFLIIWMVMMEVSRRVLYGHTFWGLVSPNFGVIGPFIGSGLEIIGLLLLKISQRNE